MHCDTLSRRSHLDAQEALRIGIVNKVVPKDELLDECFSIVERIALVPPETVKINLAVATMGLEMMGLRKALNLNAELSAMAHVSKREEFNKHLEDARKEGGLRAFLQARDTRSCRSPSARVRRGSEGGAARAAWYANLNPRYELPQSAIPESRRCGRRTSGARPRSLGA